MALKKFRDAQAGSVFDAVIEIDETPRQLAGELRADSGFSGAHESGESDDRSWKSASHAESLDECVTRRKECGMFALSEALKFVSFAPTESALRITVLSLNADLCVLIAFEYADSAAEGRKFYFGEAVADRAEKPFCVFRSAAAETVRVWFEERFGAIVHSAGRCLRIQIERIGAGKAHFHQATAALHGVNTGANEIPVEENVAGGGSQIYPGQ